MNEPIRAPPENDWLDTQPSKGGTSVNVKELLYLNYI